jgi:hypothetical protein
VLAGERKISADASHLSGFLLLIMLMIHVALGLRRSPAASVELCRFKGCDE